MQSLQFGPWAILYGAAALQGLFVAAVLFLTNKGNPRANRLLAILILAFSWTRFLSFVNLAEIYRFWPHLLSAGAPLWYLLPPLYYFYVKALLAQPLRWNAFSVVHALPAIAILIYMFPYYLLPAASKLHLLLDPDMSSARRLTMLCFSLLYGLQNLVYLALCLKHLQHHEHANNRAAIQAKPAYVSWLKFLFVLMILFAVFHLIVAGYEFLTNSRLIRMDYFPMALFTVMVYAIAYLAIQQPEKLFPPRLKIRKPAMTNGDSQLDAQQIMKQLQIIMATEKPYRNNSLKYSDLAAQLGISVRLLSRILNEELGQSFNDFVNAYRVQEVKEQLSGKENGEHTLLAIALDAGFNSKTSFNRIFKNYTGMTPTEFLRQQGLRFKSPAES
ncbi:MAG: helix-turn-helix domain-containing protein [bacterium]